MVNRKHISSWMPCLSKRNDRITTTLAAENFPNETWIQAIFQPKSTRNIEGVLCNLSLVSGGCFYNKSGAKSGKTWGKNRVDVTIALHNTEMNSEKKSLSNNCGGKKRSRKRKRQTKSTSSLINLLYFSDNSHAKQAKKSDATPKKDSG